MEPTAYYVSTALQSLRHGLRRATSLYTRETLVQRKPAHHALHRVVYRSAPFNKLVLFNREKICHLRLLYSSFVNRQ